MSAGPASALRIIAVGDELLEGRTADTNSGRIQRALGRHVVQAAGVEVVPDRPAVIRAALDRTGQGDLVFLCGGLGSTPDDLTRETAAEWGGARLHEDPQLRRELEERLAKLKILPADDILRRAVRRQCLVPEGMTPLRNHVGSAPGLAGPLRGRTVVLLPGPPAELASVLPGVVEWLEERDLLPAAREARLWRTAQIPELALVRRCDPVRERRPDLEWSFWLTEWGVDARLAAPPGETAELDEAAAEVDRLLGRLVYSREMIPLPEVVQHEMIRRGRTVAVAESCTAGLLGAALTEASGSSGFFRGGILSYDDEVKANLLGVPGADLAAHGAVSEPVVRAMAVGARERVGADYALAVSGISGPTGGSEEKPVGTTWIGVATPEAVFARRYRFLADRHRNRRLTTACAIDALRRVLDTGDDVSPFHEDDHWGGKG